MKTGFEQPAIIFGCASFPIEQGAKTMRRIQFGDFEVDLDLFTLKNRGSVVEIGKRTLDLLICLVENRDRVVDHEFLRREVWGSASLSPSAIPTCVLELRRALDEDSAKPSLIVSIRGRGYRFIGIVRSIPKFRRTIAQPLDELPFVGRKPEIAILRESLRSSVAEARGHLVLIRAEAGMGKSRLLAEFLKTVPNTIPTLVARNSSIEGTPAFWPWTRILRDALAAQKGANKELVENARSLSTIFPEIPSSLAPEFDQFGSLDRFSVLTRWTTTIRCISRGAPLLLAFEDIHLADFDSLSLLAWITEELSFDPVTVVATHRPPIDASAVAHGLSELSTLARCRNVDLAPLTAPDIKEMLDPLSQEKTALSEALEARTAGNAFYVTHLIRYLDERSHAADSLSLVSALPSDGRKIVSRQLSDLPISSREALAVASVWRGSFPISITADILEVSDAELLQRLEAPRRAWIIREEGTDFTFTHALLQEALYQTLGAARRREIHLLLASALIDTGNAHPALISDHLTAAAPLADLKVARRYAILAGRDAAARLAFSESRTFFHRAVFDIGLASGCTMAEHCRTLLQSANAELYSGDRPRARKTLLTAANIARTASLPELLADCALQLAPDFLAIEIGAYDSQLIALLREALAGIQSDQNSTRSQLLARLSNALLWSNDARDSEEIAVDALRLARDCGDVVSLSAALAARADSLAGPDRLEKRMKVTKELQKVVRAENKMPDAVMQHVRLISTLLEIGDIRAVDSEITSCERIATEMNLPQYLWYTKTFRAMRRLMEGDFPETHRLARESHELGGKHGDENVPHSRACQTACILIEQNNAAAALPTISEMASKRPLVRSWAAGAGYIQLVSGRLAEALSLLNTFDNREVNLLFRETGGSAGVSFLAEIAVFSGDLERRSLLYELCCRAPTSGATLGFAIAYFGCFSRYAGILAHSLGLKSEAIEHLRNAIDLESKRGTVLYRAHAELDLANVLVSEGCAESEIQHLNASVRSFCEGSPFHRISDRLHLLELRLDKMGLGLHQTQRA